MVDGLPWNWESFPDYLDALDARELDIDIAAQVAVPHSALRIFVMGERGAQHEAPTADDLAQMRALVADAVARRSLRGHDVAQHDAPDQGGRTGAEPLFRGRRAARADGRPWRCRCRGVPDHPGTGQ